MSHQNDSTAQALENLSAIKNGDDPRQSTGEDAQSRTCVDKVQDELDRLFEEHEMPDELDRSDVNGYVANWTGKIGNCKYNTRIESKEHGKRISGRESVTGEYAVGIAKRAFDSKDTWLDTVAHELAHVTAYVKNGHSSPGHGILWQQEAERLGADPSRTDRISEENRVEPNYIVECPGCGNKWERQRKSKTVKHPGRYRCGDCDTNLESREV